jgi:hypothetical protein
MAGLESLLHSSIRQRKDIKHKDHTTRTCKTSMLTMMAMGTDTLKITTSTTNSTREMVEGQAGAASIRHTRPRVTRRNRTTLGVEEAEVVEIQEGKTCT